jgi:hypothetical protein
VAGNPDSDADWSNNQCPENNYALALTILSTHLIQFQFQYKKGNDGSESQ